MARPDAQSSLRERLMRRIIRSADFQAGLVLTLLAVLGLWLSSQLRTGTAVRMGPGYLPALISSILLALGLAISAMAVFKSSKPAGAWYLRPLLSVLAALLVFWAGVDRLGLFVTTALVVIVASLATPESRWVEVLLVALGLAAFSNILFITLLGLAIPAWPQFGAF
jgi:putative tricarboxylic transport membrane protein